MAIKITTRIECEGSNTASVSTLGAETIVGAHLGVTPIFFPGCAIFCVSIRGTPRERSTLNLSLPLSVFCTHALCFFLVGGWKENIQSAGFNIAPSKATTNTK